MAQRLITIIFLTYQVFMSFRILFLPGTISGEKSDSLEITR